MAQMRETAERLLKVLVDQGIDTLVPTPTVDSFCGYQYGPARDILHVNPGEEIDLLKRLAELELLEREWVDKVHLCPFCRHFALNFREACPQCRSTHLELVEMIHHYRCGYVSQEREFQDGIHLVCPKCHERLRHLGLDYERPQANYRCDACGFVFTEPQTSCLSLTCGREFPIEQALQEIIYAYRITPKGVLAAQQGLHSVTASPPFIDAARGLYTSAFFFDMLAREIQRAVRYRLPLSLMVIKPCGAQDYQHVWGREATELLLKHLAIVVKETVRTCDLVAEVEHDRWVVMLPNTSLEHAKIAARRLRETVMAFLAREQEPRLTVAIGLAELEPGEDGSQLVDRARQRCDEAEQHEGGGIRA
ncbi:MAG: diguanylate cyclase [Nitrospirae bacterium]|nr:MAG: diguanylate cyclase [Nitrospirota bacterium]